MLKSQQVVERSGDVFEAFGARPTIRSMFQVRKPAAFTASETSRCAMVPWRRPEVGQDAGWVDCTPKLILRHTTAPIRDESLELGVLGIALDGHLGVVATRYGVEDGEQLVGAESRGRATTEEHRGGRRQSVGLGEFESR